VRFTWTIYALAEPLPLATAGDVRYVGFTTKTPEHRLREHRYNATSDAVGYKQLHARRNRWQRKLYQMGVAPAQTVLESGTWEGDDPDEFRAVWAPAERRWVAHYRALGADLTNMTDGGDGTPGRHHTEEAKAKIAANTRAAQLGRKHTPETRAKMSESARRRQAAPEVRAAMSESLRKRVFTAEAVERMRENGRRSGHSPEALEKRAAQIRGRKATAETRAKLCAAAQMRIARPGALDMQRASLRAGKHVKLNAEKVREIRAAVAGGESQSSVAVRYGLHSASVCNIVKRKTWRDVQDEVVVA
jgi:hypothetical protein